MVGLDPAMRNIISPNQSPKIHEPPLLYCFWWGGVVVTVRGIEKSLQIILIIRKPPAYFPTLSLRTGMSSS